MRYYITLLLTSTIFLFKCNYSHALERGFAPGEIYFGSYWYWVNIGERYNAIFFSDDHGQTLEIKYVCDIDSGDMKPGFLYRDATPKVFYNIDQPDLWISFDNCSTWQICTNTIAPNAYYATGNEEGAIYTRSSDYAGLFKSIDYASSFEQVKEDSVFGILEVGTEMEEIYFYWGPSSFGPFQINYSDNSGESFTNINEHDSIIAGGPDKHPDIYRGANSGELYLVSWFPPANFKIFHSTDYGYSFELHFVSPICDFVHESYTFTPGIELGEFYFIKKLPWFDGINTKVHIYYSSDTAKTFTEHIHILDSNFPVGIYNEDIIEHNLLSFYNYPNPFTNTTTLKFENIEPGNYIIEISSLSGQAVLRKEEYLNIGDKQVQLNTNSFSPGVYLCAIKQNGQVFGVQKMVKR